MASAAFFEPEIRVEPTSRRPPSIMNLSINYAENRSLIAEIFRQNYGKCIEQQLVLVQMECLLKYLKGLILP